jgi:hypothetical protein
MGGEGDPAILGLVDVVDGADGGDHPGFTWRSDRITYLGDGASASAGECAVPAAAFTACSRDHTAWASFDLHGGFDADGWAPVMAGCRMICTDHTGWGAWFGLSVAFSGWPTAVGTAEDPRLRFQGRADLVAAADGRPLVQVAFVLGIDRRGAIEVDGYEFELGEAAVTTVGQFQLYYDATGLAG